MLERSKPEFITESYPTISFVMLFSALVMLFAALLLTSTTVGNAAPSIANLYRLSSVDMKEGTPT